MVGDYAMGMTSFWYRSLHLRIGDSHELRGYRISHVLHRQQSFCPMEVAFARFRGTDSLRLFALRGSHHRDRIQRVFVPLHEGASVLVRRCLQRLS